MSEKIVLFENDLSDEGQKRQAIKNIIVFKLNDEWYGVDVLYVKEVVPTHPISVLPNVPSYILGIMNVRGNILSVMNLKAIFGLTSLKDDESQRIVIVEDKGMSVGLLVDGSEKTMGVPENLIEPALSLLEDEKRDLLEGQVKVDGKLVALVSAPKLLELTCLRNS